jgi:hypothetical protein
VRFVSDTPPAALVSRLAKVYLDNGSAIAPVVRALFTSAEFAASVGAKVRTPFEDVVATLRVLGLGVERVDPTANPTGIAGVQALYWMLDSVGQAPLHWLLSGQLVRWNNHICLAAGWWPTQLTRPASLVRHLVPVLPSTYGGLVDALCRRLLGTPMSSGHAATLLTFLGKQAGSGLTASDEAVGWKFPNLVALVLDSPYFLVR